MTQREPFYAWTIFDRPLDWPHGAVVRRFNYDQPTQVAFYGTSVEHVRRMLLAHHPYLHRILRDPTDHPSVVETWI